MSKKEPFNDAAQGKDEAKKQQISEWQRERDRALKICREEQKRRRDDDMERARRQILLEHNQPVLKPDNVRTKPLTAKRLEERASLMVEAQNLRELNAIREECKRKIAALENSARQEHAQSAIERTRSPHEIKTIFNGIPNHRDGHEPERER